MRFVDGMDDLFTILSMGTITYIGGEVLKKVGQTHLALGLDIITFLLGARVVFVVVRSAIHFAQSVFYLM